MTAVRTVRSLPPCGGGLPRALPLPPPPSLTSRASSARLGPRKGGGNNSYPSVVSYPSGVVIKQHNALVIHALDDIAARSGLDIGLPLANARAICPELTVFDADPVADAKTLDDIADWCDRFTPLVALDPPHGLLLVTLRPTQPTSRGTFQPKR